MSWQEKSHKEIYDTIAERLKVMRKSYGFTQEELAEQAGISRSTIARIEKGETITLDAIIRIFRCFHTLERFEHLFETTPLSPLELYRNERK